MTLIATSTYLEALRDVQYHLVAALTLLVWEFFLTLGEESEYIWRMRHCFCKWCYFYFRYVLLAAQIFHLVISPVLSSGHMSDSLCITFYRYAISILQLSTSMIEIIWAIRAYALFNRNYKVGIILGSLLLCNLCFATVQVVRSSTAKYFETCILPLPVDDFGNIHTGVVILIQITLIGMIVYKHLETRRTPILSFLLREATSNSIAVFALCGIAITIIGLDDHRIIAVIYWSISVHSAIGCRLVLNMEPFTRRDVSTDEEVVLTSYISV